MYVLFVASGENCSVLVQLNTPIKCLPSQIFTWLTFAWNVLHGTTLVGRGLKSQMRHDTSYHFVVHITSVS